MVQYRPPFGSLWTPLDPFGPQLQLSKKKERRSQPKTRESCGSKDICSALAVGQSDVGDGGRDPNWNETCLVTLESDQGLKGTLNSPLERSDDDAERW